MLKIINLKIISSCLCCVALLLENTMINSDTHLSKGVKFGEAFCPPAIVQFWNFLKSNVIPNLDYDSSAGENSTCTTSKKNNLFVSPFWTYMRKTVLL